MKKYKFLFIVLINIIWVGLLFYFYVPVNETNDDLTMSAIAAGAYGCYENRLIFQNIIYSTFLQLFYKISPGINWYWFFQLAIMILSFSSIGYTLIQRNSLLIGCLLYGIIIFVFSTEFYLLFQFTRISMLSCIAGYMLIFHSIQYAERKKYIFLGVLLVILSCLIRYRGFIGASGFAFFIGLSQIPIKKNEVKKRNATKLIIYLGILFCICFSSALFNTWFYNKDSSWENYMSYLSTRSKIVDYGWPDYTLYKSEYNKLNISENDILMYSNNNLADEDVLTNESIKKIYEIKKIDNQNRWKLKNIISNVYNYYKYQRDYIIIYLVMFLIFNVLFHMNRYSLIALINFILFSGIITYYYILLRPVPRTVMPTLFIGMCVLLFGYEKKHLKNGKLLNVTVVIVLLMIIFNYGRISPYYLQLKSSQINENRYYNELLLEKDRIYVADHGAFKQNYLFFPAWKKFTRNYYINHLLYGDWFSRSPILNHVKDNLNIDNISNSLVLLDNMFLYTRDNEEIIKNYLNEHYFNGFVNYSISEFTECGKIVRFCLNNVYGEYTEIPFEIDEIQPIQHDKRFLEISLLCDIGHTRYNNMYLKYVKSDNSTALVYLEQEGAESTPFKLKVIIPRKDISEIVDYKGLKVLGK